MSLELTFGFVAYTVYIERKNQMTENLTRRTVAKGAAWSVPAVVASTAIPVYAASSPSVQVSLNPDAIVPVATITGTKSFTASGESDSSGDGGTSYSINSGQWQFVPPAELGTVTAFKVEEVVGSAAFVVSASGVKSTATVTKASSPETQTIGSGVDRVVEIRSQVPYRLLAKKADNYMEKVSIPFQLTWFNGLSQVGQVNTYYINWDFSIAPDWFGNYPDEGSVSTSGEGYSISTLPLYE